MVAAWVLPGVDIRSFWGALLVAVIVSALNAVIPPVLAALRLPLTLVLGFLLVLIADAAILLATDALTDGILTVDNFGWALLASLVVAAVSVVLAVLLGSDDMSSIRIAHRIARRQGIIDSTDVPGIVYLEIDGLALPILQRAMRDGNAPNMARWARETHRLAEWETDLSSQTGASQAGILLGSNEDISAFRWVEKETATMMTCSAPPDCAELERRLGTGIGLLVDGGASRGNLLSGEAQDVILTVSRMEAEKKANPGYRAFFANGDNATRTLVLFGWEVILEWTAALRAIRRDVQPRGHRGGIYPLMRGALCVFVRELIVSGVLTDIMRGRPAVYATFSSYDEVAHHSGLERADTLEALRKLDDKFGHIEMAPASTPRGRTRSSFSPITARPRARRSSSATATGSTTWSSARSPGATSRGSPAVTSRARWSATRSARRPGKTRSGPRTTSPTATSSCWAPATSGSSTSWKSAAGSRSRRSTSATPSSSPRSETTPTSAGCSSAPPSTAPSRSEQAAPTTSHKVASKATTHSPTSHPTPPSTSSAPTASSTSATSWSAASTTPASTKAAPSKS